MSSPLGTQLSLDGCDASGLLSLAPESADGREELGHRRALGAEPEPQLNQVNRCSACNFLDARAALSLGGRAHHSHAGVLGRAGLGWAPERAETWPVWRRRTPTQQGVRGPRPLLPAPEPELSFFRSVPCKAAGLCLCQVTDRVDGALNVAWRADLGPLTNPTCLCCCSGDSLRGRAGSQGAGSSQRDPKHLTDSQEGAQDLGLRGSLCPREREMGLEGREHL